MEPYLVYLAYLVAALGSAAVFVALPKDGRVTRRAILLPFLALAIGGVVLLLARITGDGGRPIYFYLLTLLALGGAVRVVTHPKPVYSALFFVMVVLSTAALLVMVGAEFLGAALVIVYAGAILVTYVFVIMLAQSPDSDRDVIDSTFVYDTNAREPFAAAVAGFVLVATVAGVIVSREPMSASMATPAGGHTLAIGKVLLRDFAVSVELAGVLLMVAMIGAIALAWRKMPTEGHAAPRTAPSDEIGRHVKPF